MDKSARISLANIIWTAGLGVAGLIGVSLTTGAKTEHREPATKLAVLSDSVASLQRKTTALELVAGLDPDDSVASTGAGGDTLLQRTDRLSENLRQVSEKLESDADQVARTPSIMPTSGWLTSLFSASRFHPLLHQYRPHLGVDIAAPYGSVIVAPAAGIVTRVGNAAGYGRVLEIDHGNGIVTKYGHLSHFLVREHDAVVRGEPIARVGSSGLSTGPHLHYEVHVNGEVVDPLSYVLPSTIPDPVRGSQREVATPED